MRRLLLLLFFLPIIALAQDGKGWSRDLPHGFQVVATQDGHFMVLGSKKETAGEVETHTPYLARYDADGELVYERYYSHRSGASLQATKMDLMSNGDLWVTGMAFKADGSEYHLLSRISPASGDTLYMRLYPNIGANLEFYLQTTPQGDRFYFVSVPYGGDIPAGLVEEISESFNPIRSYDIIMGIHGGQPHPFSTTSPEGDILFYSTYNASLSKISPEGEISTSSFNDIRGQYVLSAPTPLGGALVLTHSKSLLLDANLVRGSEAPYADYTPLMTNELPTWLKSSADGFIVGGIFESNDEKYSPYIMKIDFQGNLVWKRHYPEEEGTELVDLAPADDGEAVLLLRRAEAVRLVKTGSQGQVLSAKENLEGQTISLYPNPVQADRLSIKFPKSFSGVLQLFDQTGRLQFEKSLPPTNSYQLELSTSMAPGIYHLRLSDGRGEAQAVRFVKD